MALIPDLPAATTVASTDVFVIDTGSQTKKITYADAIKAVTITNGNIDFTQHSAYIVTITDNAIDSQRRDFVLTSATTRGFYLANNPSAIYAITFTVSVSGGTLSISDAKRATIGVANSMSSATLPTIYRITAIR